MILFYVALGVIGLFVLYLIVRLGSTAIFKSYFDQLKNYREEKKNGN